MDPKIVWTQNLFGPKMHLRMKFDSVCFCQTPVLGLGLGVDFTFAGGNHKNHNHKNYNNPHWNFIKGTILGDKEAYLPIVVVLVQSSH